MNDIFNKTQFLYSTNATFIADLYKQYLQNPSSISSINNLNTINQVQSNQEQSNAYSFVEFGKSGHTAAKKKAQENAVIKIIQKEWERESERLDSKKNGQYAKNPINKNNCGDKSLV